MVAAIKLRRCDKSTIVDDCDAPLFENRKCYLSKDGYAYTWDTNKKQCVLLHKILIPSAGNKHIDHIDGNKLNNQRSNLRLCTNQQNTWNKKKSQGGSKYKGVCQESRSGKWRATITFNYKQRHIGHYDKEDDAAAAYDYVASHLFGEFAKLNFPDRDYTNYVDPIKRRKSKGELISVGFNKINS